MAAFFLRICSLDLSHFLHEVERPEALKTEGGKFFEKTLACLKTDQNDPKFPDLSVCPIRQHCFLVLVR